MSECACSCGWRGDGGDLQTHVENPGTDDVSIELNCCPDCGEFVVQDGADDWEDSCFDESEG